MAVETGTVQVVMPAMGDSVAEGTVLEWHKQGGDSVAADETLVEISTDKVDAEVPAPVAGTVAEIHAEEGDTVTVGQVIARMSAGDGAGAPAAAPSSAAATDGAPTPSAPAAPTPAAGNGANASPVAQRVAAAEGVDLTGVSGSARGGRITKADVLAAAGNGAPAAPAAAPAAPAAAPGESAQQLKGSAAALAR